MSWIYQSDQVASGSFNSATPALTASFTLRDPDMNRKGLYVCNSTTVDLDLKLDSGASLTDYNIKVPSNYLYEFPLPVWLGKVTAIFSTTGSGLVQVTQTY
jgi:hypothetical protein